jgi:putative flippase GtrA
MQHRFVFKKSGGHAIFFQRYVFVTSIMQIIFFRRYVFVTLIMQIINMIMFWGLVTYTSIHYLLAQIIVIGLVFICNYIINSTYTFMKTS